MQNYTFLFIPQNKWQRICAFYCLYATKPSFFWYCMISNRSFRFTKRGARLIVGHPLRKLNGGLWQWQIPLTALECIGTSIVLCCTFTTSHLISASGRRSDNLRTYLRVLPRRESSFQVLSDKEERLHYMQHPQHYTHVSMLKFFLH